MFVAKWSSSVIRGIAYCASVSLISALQPISRCEGPRREEMPRARLLHSRHSTLQILFDQEGPNILIVGDVHGCYEEMMQLYDTAGSPEIVILVGDLVNKGPHSAKVVRHVRTTPGWFTVRGNHDNGALRAVTGDPEQSTKKKYEWLFSHTTNQEANNGCVLSDDDVQWLADLPYTIRIPAYTEQENDIVIVHAGFVPGIPLEDQTDATMVTVRTVSGAKEDGQYQYDSSDHGVPWAKVWSGPDFVIFGHDAKRGLQREPYALGLDTGACYGKKLTGILLPSKTIYQVDSLQTYCPISGEDD